MMAGDPTKPGPFVLRVKVPADTVIAPHTHSTSKTLTILSGSICHQHGKTIDKAAGEMLKAGGFIYLPQDMPHALWTTTGPWSCRSTAPEYVDPADDPSRKADRRG